MSKNTQHTPGQWRCYNETCVVDNNNEFICQTMLDNEDIVGLPKDEVVAIQIQAESNARLIATAPDLLIALERLLQLCEAGEGADMYCQEQARAAIARARG